MTGQKEEKKEYKKHENCRRRDRTESEALQEVLADLKMFQFIYKKAQMDGQGGQILLLSPFSVMIFLI